MTDRGTGAARGGSRRAAARLGLAALSFALALAVGIPLSRVARRLAREHRETVKVVDGTATLGELLRTAAREGPPVLDEGIVRRPVSEEVSRMLHPVLREPRGKCVYDPFAYYVNKPGLRERIPFDEHPGGGFERRTNGLGLRDDDEVRAVRPDLRVLVAGDSHTEGVVPNARSFSNVLEGRLAGDGRTAEVLNAGCGGYDAYHCLGVLEKHLALEPHVFVLVVYGGNDFAGCLSLHRWFRRLPPGPVSPELDAGQRAALETSASAVAQVLRQLALFWFLPEEEELGLAGTVDAVTEAARLCAERGIRFLCAYLPSVAEAQPRVAADLLRRAAEAWGLPPEALERAGEPGRRFRERMAQRGVAVLDLTPVLAASEEPAYWRSDLHLNARGHRLVAERLARELGAR